MQNCIEKQKDLFWREVGEGRVVVISTAGQRISKTYQKRLDWIGLAREASLSVDVGDTDFQ